MMLGKEPKAVSGADLGDCYPIECGSSCLTGSFGVERPCSFFLGA